VVVGDIPNNPTLADFSYHIRIVKIFGSKVSKFHYFFIIFSFVVILMKNVESYIINRIILPRGNSGFFRSYFPAENGVSCCKNVILTFFNLGKQRLGIR